uniref:Uncharacterized protein n=1 Tax=Arundo donax TaxID=35708 RepID=A0A0A9MEM7_ARUDO
MPIVKRGIVKLRTIVVTEEIRKNLDFDQMTLWCYLLQRSPDFINQHDKNSNSPIKQSLSKE